MVVRMFAILDREYVDAIYINRKNPPEAYFIQQARLLPL